MSSEVARTRAVIEAETRAAWFAIHGLRQGGAEHHVIEARMNSVLEGLFNEVGDVAGCEIITALDASISSCKQEDAS